MMLIEITMIISSLRLTNYLPSPEQGKTDLNHKA